MHRELLLFPDEWTSDVFAAAAVIRKILFIQTTAINFLPEVAIDRLFIKP